LGVRTEERQAVSVKPNNEHPWSMRMEIPVCRLTEHLSYFGQPAPEKPQSETQAQEFQNETEVLAAVNRRG
jgi:hypothetical protein